jgi:hypothetical protein
MIFSDLLMISGLHNGSKRSVATARINVIVPFDVKRLNSCNVRTVIREERRD